jgi:hypothetical protein
MLPALREEVQGRWFAILAAGWLATWLRDDTQSLHPFIYRSNYTQVLLQAGVFLPSLNYVLSYWTFASSPMMSTFRERKVPALKSQQIPCHDTTISLRRVFVAILNASRAILSHSKSSDWSIGDFFHISYCSLAVMNLRCSSARGKNSVNLPYAPFTRSRTVFISLTSSAHTMSL